MMQMLPRRILALWLERLATDHVKRKRRGRQHETDDAADQPLVVAARRGAALVLSAVNEAAQALGLASGFHAGLYGRETDSPAWYLHGLFA